MWSAGLDEAQAGIKIVGRNINNLRYADDTTLMGEREELKSFLVKVKEEREKAGLKHNIQKTKIRASSPISSWQIDGKTMEIVINFIFLGSKITADGDCSHDKRCLLFGRRAVTNLGSILKSRDIHLADKGLSSQSYDFSSCRVWMWQLRNKRDWAPKQWCLWTVVLEKTLESPLDSKDIKPVNPKGNQP